MWPIRAQPGDLVKMVQPHTHTHTHTHKGGNVLMTIRDMLIPSARSDIIIWSSILLSCALSDAGSY